MADAVKIYDAAIDEHRPVTQFDVDLLNVQARCGGLLREIMRTLSDSKGIEITHYRNCLVRIQNVAQAVMADAKAMSKN